MMRLDAEITNSLSNDDEKSLLESFQRYIEVEKPNLVILEDYNKGVLTGHVIAKVIELCKQHSILTAVDPKRKNFFAYKGADVFKPNLSEAKEGLNIIQEGVDEDLLSAIHESLNAQLNHKVSLITLSEKGVFYQSEKDKKLIPTHVRSIADVSGAGDTVIAVASAVYAASQNLQWMAEIANIAGGLVCEEVGTVAINRERLKQECTALLASQ
jgi:D-glycero-beta-D-manno-heptose-7-phosphate kinase